LIFVRVQGEFRPATGLPGVPGSHGKATALQVVECDRTMWGVKLTEVRFEMLSNQRL